MAAHALCSWQHGGWHAQEVSRHVVGTRTHPPARVAPQRANLGPPHRARQILLLADEGQRDAAIATSVHVGALTLQRVRKRYAEAGVEAGLGERPRPGGQPKLDGKQEALLVALTCSEPPEDRPTWTMQLLADRMMAIGAVDTISDEPVRRVLKKTSLRHG